MKNPFEGIKPLKAAELIASAFLALILIVGAIYVHKSYVAEKTLFGKEVIYSNHFYHAQTVSALPNNRLLFGECVETKSHIRVTTDTVIFDTEKGSVGYKPVGVDGQAGLHCIRKDGVTVVLVRIKEDSTSTNVEDELILLQQPEGTLVLTNKKGCVSKD